MKRYAFLAVALGAAAMVACGENGVQKITAPATGASIKFFNYGVGDPSVNFYANDVKVTAVSTGNCTPLPADTTAARICLTQGNEVTSGTAYGGAGNGGLYNGMAPGSYTLAGKITAATDNGLAISSMSTTLENGKFYSYYLSGVYDPTAKKTEGFVVEDPLPATIDYANTAVRLVNAIPTSGPLTLYAKSQVTGVETAIGGAVAYKSAGSFVSLPGGLYDLSIRTAGSSTNVASATGVTLSNSRVYTVNARGDVTSSVTANKPALTTVSNR